MDHTPEKELRAGRASLRSCILEKEQELHRVPFLGKRRHFRGREQQDLWGSVSYEVVHFCFIPGNAIGSKCWHTAPQPHSCAPRTALLPLWFKANLRQRVYRHSEQPSTETLKYKLALCVKEQQEAGGCSAKVRGA